MTTVEILGEMKLTDFEVNERKEHNLYKMVIEIDAEKKDFPLKIEHGISNIMLESRELMVVPTLQTNTGQLLHFTLNNLEVSLDKEFLNISTFMECESIKGKVMISFNKEDDFEIRRTINRKALPQTHEQLHSQMAKA